MLTFKITIPVVTDLRLDERRVEAAMADAARSAMRRRGLERGRNLVGAHAAVSKAAEREIDEQLTERGVEWFPREV